MSGLFARPCINEVNRALILVLETPVTLSYLSIRNDRAGLAKAVRFYHDPSESGETQDRVGV